MYIFDKGTAADCISHSNAEIMYVGYIIWDVLSVYTKQRLHLVIYTYFEFKFVCIVHSGHSTSTIQAEGVLV